MSRWSRKLLFFAALFFASPAVPLFILGWAYWERQHHRPVLAGFPDFIGSMSAAGRVVFFTVAFGGSELVASDFFASSYFNTVDEHVAPILGVFLLMALMLILAADFILRSAVAGIRNVADRR